MDWIYCYVILIECLLIFALFLLVKVCKKHVILRDRLLSDDKKKHIFTCDRRNMCYLSINEISIRDHCLEIFKHHCEINELLPV